MLNRILALTLVPFFSWAIDTSSLNVDEAAMFGSSNQSMVALESLTKTGLGSNAFPQVKFGGRLFTSADWGIRRGLGSTNYAWSNNLLQTYLQGDLSLDVRVYDGFRIFSSASVSYAPAFSTPYSPIAVSNPLTGLTATNILTNYQASTNIAAIAFKEFFADLNIARTVYLRVGKQNLAWGRGYFWTPTDLINIQKVDFVNRDISREGTYGVRLHIPYKTFFNFYGFANAGSTLDFSKYSLALKTEFLLGPVEFALSGLFRPNRRSVFGADFSFGIAGWNFYGEGLLAQDGQTDKLRTNVITNGSLTYAIPEPYRETNAFLRANIGVSKSLDQDRLTFGVEGFYNGEGYDNNPLGDPTLKPLFSLGQGYKPFEFGKWYAAAYVSRSELFAKTTTIAASVVWNILDSSILVSPSITVVPFDYFTASFRLPMYFGPDDREFTFQNRQLNAQLELSYRF